MWRCLSSNPSQQLVARGSLCLRSNPPFLRVRVHCAHGSVAPMSDTGEVRTLTQEGTGGRGAATHARCCFGRCSSKVGAFVLTSLFAHEVLVAFIFVARRSDWASGRHIPLLTVRICQLFVILGTYIGLWLQRHYFLIPFVVAQLTIGAYADLTTWMLLMRELYSKGDVPDESSPLLYLALPILLYAAFDVFVTYVMYQCFALFKSRWSNNQARPSEAIELTQMEMF